MEAEYYSLASEHKRFIRENSIHRQTDEAKRKFAARNFYLEVLEEFSLGLFIGSVSKTYYLFAQETPRVTRFFQLGEKWLRENQDAKVMTEKGLIKFSNSQAYCSLIELLDRYSLNDWMLERVLATFKIWGEPDASLYGVFPPIKWRKTFEDYRGRLYTGNPIDSETLERGLVRYELSSMYLPFLYRARGDEKFSSYKSELVSEFKKHLDEHEKGMTTSKFNRKHFEWVFFRHMFECSDEIIARVYEKEVESIKEGRKKTGELLDMNFDALPVGRRKGKLRETLENSEGSGVSSYVKGKVFRMSDTIESANS